VLHKRVAGGSHLLLSVPNAAHPPSFASPPRWAGSRRSSWHWYSHYVLVPAHKTACKRTVLEVRQAYPERLLKTSSS
jgi:hypothetical protein